MARRIRSAKGETVDFDLLHIKQQMTSTKPTKSVRARQDFIDRRLRRKIKKAPVPAPKIKSDETQVDPKMPGTEDAVESKLIDEQLTTEVPMPATKTKQKTRPKTTDIEEK